VIRSVSNSGPNNQAPSLTSSGPGPELLLNCCTIDRSVAAQYGSPASSAKKKPPSLVPRSPAWREQLRELIHVVVGGQATGRVPRQDDLCCRAEPCVLDEVVNGSKEVAVASEVKRHRLAVVRCVGHCRIITCREYLPYETLVQSAINQRASPAKEPPSW